MEQRPTSKQPAVLVRAGLPLAIALLGTAACQTNQAGHLNAVQLGDTSNPAARGSPVDELRAACGADGSPTASGAATIQRHPYLQQVTSSSAMLGWVTTSPDGASVVVTTTDGKPLQTAAAVGEDTTLESADQRQLWARIDGLSPDTIYCYTLRDAAGALTLPTGFRTAPTAAPTEPVRFLAFGDSGGGGSDQYALLEQMYTVPYDLMVHTGDLAYGKGTIGQFEDNVFGVYSDLLRNVPLFPAAGNHEYDTNSAEPFRDVFALPGDSGEKWYSYDWGNVHFAALDTEADYRTQAAWLDKDLASSTQPWKILYLHRPMYSNGTHGSDTALRSALEPVLERHHVQLVLAGHDHNYERTTPQRGITHIVTGGGGVGTRSVGRAGFTAFSADVIHFVYVEVGADELSVHAIDAGGIEFDSAVIKR